MSSVRDHQLQCLSAFDKMHCRKPGKRKTEI